MMEWNYMNLKYIILLLKMHFKQYKTNQYVQQMNLLNNVSIQLT